MYKPQSIQTQSWTNYPKQSYSIITDGFIMGQQFIINAQLKTLKGGINIRQSISKRRSNKLKDSIELWLKLPHQANIYTKIVPQKSIKINYQNRLKKWNLYTALNINYDNNKYQFNIGGIYKQKYIINNRLKVFIQDTKDKICYYNKFLFNKGPFYFAFIGSIDLNRFILQKNNLLFNYQIQQHQLYFRAETCGWRQKSLKIKHPTSYFDLLIFDYIYNASKYKTYAAQLTINCPKLELVQAAFVVQQWISEYKLDTKAKMTTKGNFSLFFKRAVPNLEDTINIACGISAITNRFNKLSFRYGCEIDINI